MSGNDQLQAVIETNKGNIKFQLFSDKASLTVANFVNLSRRGYYDNIKFHRVIPEFMIQGGCPLGNGTGGPGYTFQDEFDQGLCHDKPGMLSMANAGPQTNGSQFFITHVPTPWLDQKHTIFGQVISDEDQKIVDNIVQGDTITNITIQGDVSDLMEKNRTDIDKWNSILDK